jgi:hypothetical protein
MSKTTISPADRIADLIKEMVTKNIFTPDGLEYIQKLEKENVNSREVIEKLTRDLEEKTQDFIAAQLELTQLNSRENSVKYREKTVAEGEKQLEQKEWVFKIKEAGLDSQASENSFYKTRELLEIIFRNPVYKEEFFKNSSKPIQVNGYTQQVSESENSKTEKRAE